MAWFALIRGERVRLHSAAAPVGGELTLHGVVMAGSSGGLDEINGSPSFLCEDSVRQDSERIKQKSLLLKRNLRGCRREKVDEERRGLKQLAFPSCCPGDF